MREGCQGPGGASGRVEILQAQEVHAGRPWGWGGVRAEVTWVGGMRRSNPAHGPSLLAGLTYAASPALVQLM